MRALSGGAAVTPKTLTAWPAQGVAGVRMSLRVRYLRLPAWRVSSAARGYSRPDRSGVAG